MNTIEQAREVSLRLKRAPLQNGSNFHSEVADTIDALIAENNLLRDLIAMANGNTERAVAELAELKSQEPVEFRQFLSDVVTAAGLVEYGKKSKGLAERLSEGAFRYMAAAPVQAGAQPVQQEPVLYQRRMRPEWREREWFPWETCTKECADDFERKPILNNWIYEVRRLYAQPVQAQERKPLTDEVVRLANVALHEMPRPSTDWHEAAKRVCQAVSAHGIKEQP